MTIYWSFDLNAVADTVLYLERLDTTESYEEVLLKINNFRGSYPLKKSHEIFLSKLSKYTLDRVHADSAGKG